MTFLIKVYMLFGFVISHDVPVTIFDLTFTEEKVELLVKIDIEDLDLLVSDNRDEKEIQALINNESEFILDEEKLFFNLAKVEKDADFYVLYFKAKPIEYKKANLSIQSELMLDKDAAHSNIIKIHYNNKTRGFRLHKGRLKSELKLN